MCQGSFSSTHEIEYALAERPYRSALRKKQPTEKFGRNVNFRVLSTAEKIGTESVFSIEISNSVS